MQVKAAFVCLLVSVNASVQNLLEPPDTSSPQATIKNFLSLHEESLKRFIDYRGAPCQSTYTALQHNHKKLSSYLKTVLGFKK